MSLHISPGNVNTNRKQGIVFQILSTLQLMWKVSSEWEDIFGVRQFYFFKYQNKGVSALPCEEYSAIAKLFIQIQDVSCQPI